jgi:lipooligosaccharide transport system permease protein
VSQILPLYHAIALVRPLVTGATPGAVPLHLGVLVAYALASFAIALVLVRRRLLV